MNRPNITLNVKELLHPNKSESYTIQFAKEVAEIIGSASAIVYFYC